MRAERQGLRRAGLVIAVLWLIAIAATVAVAARSGRATFLGPVYAICLIGSVLTMRWARRGTR
ncbi:MAG: hypothetical protein ACE5IK_08245 [Acidobacteriota bacterium]